MCIGQVSVAEIKHVTYDYPYTEDEQDGFIFATFRDTVKAMPQDKFPVFYAKQVRAFPATMLVASGTVQNNEIEQAKPDGSETKDRYCKTCKCRHPKNKHSAEGRKRYAALKQAEKEKAKATMDTNDATNATSATKEDGPRLTRNRVKAKCYQSGKEHFPFCKRTPGVRGPCHIFKKTHFLYCPRPEKGPHVQERESEQISLKLRIMQAIAKRMDELFMETTLLMRVPSDICRT